MTTSKKLPPFGRAAELNPETLDNRAIVICTGSGGFTRAKSAQEGRWMPGIRHKLCLPFGDDPALYRWPVYDHIVMIWEDGTPESLDKIKQLAKCCLEYGSVWVLYAGDQITRFIPATKNKEL